MKFLSRAVILAIVGVLLVSSGVASCGPAIYPANAGPAPAAQAEPGVTRSRPAVRLNLRDPEDRDRDAALGLLLLLGMHNGRHGG